MYKRTLALAAGLALSFSSLFSQAADVLKVSAIPDEAPTELLRKFEPLGAYLEQQLGMKVEFIPVADYAAIGCPGVLPNDRVGHGLTGGPVPDDGRLPLVGDSDCCQV
jgi:phosphonate transport system substrate-binding protein